MKMSVPCDVSTVPNEVLLLLPRSGPVSLVKGEGSQVGLVSLDRRRFLSFGDTVLCGAWA